MVIDGVVDGGVDKLESAATALNQKGLKVDVEAIDTMLG
jgi:hypothetical protein